MCKVLGVCLDLKEARKGAAQVSNTLQRVEELTAETSKVPDEGRLSSRDGKRIRSGRKALSASTVSSLKLLRAALIANRPRTISGKLADHVHIYVDASYDADGFSGIDGVCLSSDGAVLGFFSEEV